MKPATLAILALATAAGAGPVLLTNAQAIRGYAAVVDGDTIRINSTAIRLAGVDAEEISEPNGPAARAALAAIVVGRTVSCEPRGRSYNRIVAVCYIGAMDIGAELVRRGAALDCLRYSAGRYRALEPAGARSRLAQKPYCLLRG